MTQPTTDAGAAQPNPPRTAYEAGEMTLLEHLKELRNRVVVSAFAVVIGVLVCLFFWQTIVGWLIAPARESYPDFKPAVFGPIESIGVAFKIGLYGGLLLASPVIIYELLAFILPGLTPREKKLILPGMAGVTFFLFSGMAFAYWVILPASLGFLLGFADEEFQSVIGAKQYIDFATRIIFWVGVSFELPMVLLVVARLGLTTWRKLLSFWRYAIVLVFVVAAVVTPTPDPITQTLVAGPLFALYFIGIFFAFLVRRRPKQEGAEVPGLPHPNAEV